MSETEKLIQAKLDLDEKVIDSIVDNVEATFSDKDQANLISKLAVKLYHLDSSLEQLGIQGMYTSTVLDALCVVLVNKLGIIEEEVLQSAIEEARKVADQSLEDSRDLYFRLEEQKQAGINPASEVNTI